MRIRGGRAGWQRELRDCDSDFIFWFRFEASTMKRRKQLGVGTAADQKWYRTSTYCTKMRCHLYFLP